MKPTTSFILLAASSLAAFALGWHLGGWRGAAKPDTASFEPPSPRPPSLGAAKATAAVNENAWNEMSRAWMTPLESADDCLRLIESLESTQHGDHHPLLVAALRDYALRRWLEIDAEGVLEFVEQSGRSRFTGGLAGPLFRVWVGLDPQSASLAFAQANPATVQAGWRDFFVKFGEADPERALEMMNSSQWQSARPRWDETPASIYAMWATRDPRAAADHLQQPVPSPDSGRHTHQPAPPLSVVAAIWARQDPAAAWKYYSELDSDPGSEVIVAILPHLSQVDPAPLEQVIAENSKLASRGSILPGLAESWTKQNLDAAIAFAHTRPDEDPLRRELLAHAARAFATADPERAIELYRSSGEGSAHEWENSGLLREAFASLAATDPNAAASRLLEFSGSDRNAAMSGILTHAMAANVEEGSRLCREWMAVPALKDSVIPALSVAVSWGHGGGNRPLGPLLEHLPEFAAHLNGYPLQGWTRTNPEEAAAFMMERAATDPNVEFDRRAVTELCFSRPEFAVDWIGKLPAGGFQESSATTLALSWSRFNPDAAQAWAESLPPGNVRDAAKRGLGRQGSE